MLNFSLIDFHFIWKGMRKNIQNKIFIFQFTPLNACSSTIWIRLNPKAGNSIQVSHLSNRDSSTWSCIDCHQGNTPDLKQSLDWSLAADRECGLSWKQCLICSATCPSYIALTLFLFLFCFNWLFSVIFIYIVHTIHNYYACVEELY